jgi:osmotically inducible protein OsmC
MFHRKATAHWSGGLKDGKGKLHSGSGALQGTDYAFRHRFGEDPGTNPEELIAAAHAGCFAMFLSGQLAQHGMTADHLEATATVTLEKVGEGFEVTKSHLDVVARIPNADREKFMTAVEASKVGCPISKLLKAAITVEAKLEG